jgi:hypothetical protein
LIQAEETAQLIHGSGGSGNKVLVACSQQIEMHHVYAAVH